MPGELAERAADIAAKHEQVAALVRESQREGLLILDPANFSWLTAGATGRGVSVLEERPALFVQNSSYRWIISSNVDTQRIFDEEVDGLGFQVKEWPWHWGRAQMLADLCQGKRLCSDVPYGDCQPLTEELQSLRRVLSPWDQARLREVGQALVHCVEATGRNFQREDSEQEVAGHLAHRLIRRGLEPIEVQVSADGRFRKYRRHGPGSARIQKTCVIRATARGFGLHATASRVASLGEPDEQFRREMDAACRWTAVLIAASAGGRPIADILKFGNQYLALAEFEDEWRLAPIGHVTGYAESEAPITPNGAGAVLPPGNAVVWLGSLGAAASADTILVTETGAELVTPAEYWPLKRITISGNAVDRPDVLVRE